MATPLFLNLSFPRSGHRSHAPAWECSPHRSAVRGRRSVLGWAPTPERGSHSKPLCRRGKKRWVSAIASTHPKQAPRCRMGSSEAETHHGRPQTAGKHCGRVYKTRPAGSAVWGRWSVPGSAPTLECGSHLKDFSCCLVLMLRLHLSWGGNTPFFEFIVPTLRSSFPRSSVGMQPTPLRGARTPERPRLGSHAGAWEPFETPLPAG